MTEVIIRTSSRTIPTRATASLTNAVMLIRRAVDSGVVKTAGRVQKAALIRVPVRKVFAGGRRTAPRRRSLAEAVSEVNDFLAAFPTQPKTGLRTTRGQAYNALITSQTSADATRNRANAAMLTSTNVYDAQGNRVGRGGVSSERSVNIIETGPHYTVVAGGNKVFVPPSRVAQLMNGEYALTSRGQYELRGIGGTGVGRAVHAGRLSGGTGGSQTIEGQELGSAGHQRVGGALRDSIELHTSSTDTLRGWEVTAGGKSAPYARYVEFGTRHAAAQPFLRPALAAHSDGLVGDIIESLKRNAGLEVGKGR